MDTIIRELDDGRKIEYRRLRIRPCILDLECRELRRDGHPYNEQWYPVSDAHLLSLNHTASDVLEFLDPRCPSCGAPGEEPGLCGDCAEPLEF